MIEFYKPLLADLWFREVLLGDAETMAYNRAWGGTIPFPRERWDGWYGRWVADCETERFYRFVTENGVFLGEAAWHLERERGIFLADVIIHASHRGKGYGKEALLLLCDAAKAHGIGALYDEIAADNPSVALFLKCGFSVVQKSGDTVLMKKDL